jgi:hypothetical protein
MSDRRFHIITHIQNLCVQLIGATRNPAEVAEAKPFLS